MASYNSILRHVDMATVKRNTQKLQERRKAEERRIEEERRAKAYKNSPLFSDWRFDLSENMTTQAMTYATTLPGTGDEINHTIKSGFADSFTPVGNDDLNDTYAKLSKAYDYENKALEFRGGKGAFSGMFGNDAFYTAMPFDGSGQYNSVDSFNITTNSFEVTDTSISFEAIAGNSSKTSEGLGSNGGTKPLRDLEVYYYVYKDDGTLDYYDFLGVIPKNTTTRTKFEFELPPELFGKEIAINFFNSANEGGITEYSWLSGQKLTVHPTELSQGTGSDYTSLIAYNILNYDFLDSNNYYKQFDVETLAYFLWSDLQKQYTGDNDWGDVGNTTKGWPAPISGGRLGLWEEDNEDPPNPNSSPMNEADLSGIVRYIKQQFQDYFTMNTTTYSVGNLNFQRKNPITVFVPLDSPDAVSFVRTDLDKKGLTPEERLKKINELLNASDEYLVRKFGDAFPGTGVVIEGDVDDALNAAYAGMNPEDFGDAPVPHDLAGDLALLGISYAMAKTAIVTFGPTIGGILKQGGYLKDLLIKGKPVGPFAGKAPRPPKITSSSKEIWNSHTGKYEVIKKGDPGWDWASRALKDKGPNSFDVYRKTGEMPGGLQGWRPQQGFDPTRPASMGGPGSMPTPDVTTPGGVAAVGGAIAGGYAIGSAINSVVKNALNWGKDKKENYNYNGETIMEEKRKLKSPKAFFNAKDIKPEFPENPPPPQIKGLHPDLVTGEKTAQRFNKLDPISAKAMPRTGIKAIDKKVAIAKTKPK